MQNLEIINFYELPNGKLIWKALNVFYDQLLVTQQRLPFMRVMYYQLLFCTTSCRLKT